MFYNVSASNGDGGSITLVIFCGDGIIDDTNYIHTIHSSGNAYFRIFDSPETVKLPDIIKDGYIIDGFYYDEDYTELVVWSSVGEGYIELNSGLFIYVKWKDNKTENTINIIFNSWFDLIKNIAVGLNTVFTTLFILDGGLSLIGIWFLVIFGIGLVFLLINCVLKIIRKRE